MSQALAFSFDFNKFLSVLTYLTQKDGPLDSFDISKLLYFADKYHLINFGRPVTGDQYIKMDFGPVPSSAYDWLKNVQGIKKRQLSPSDSCSRSFLEFIDVDLRPQYPLFTAKKAPQYKLLSESDLEALDYAIANYSGRSFSKLSKAGHNERAYLAADSNGEMEYSLFFDPEDEEQMALLELIREEQETERVLENMLS